MLDCVTLCISPLRQLTLGQQGLGPQTRTQQGNEMSIRAQQISTVWTSKHVNIITQLSAFTTSHTKNTVSFMFRWGPVSFHGIWNWGWLIHSHPLCPSNQGTSQGQLGCCSKAGTKGGQIRNQQASGYGRGFPIYPELVYFPGFPPSSASSMSCLDIYLPSQACFSLVCLFVSFFFALPPQLLTLKLAVILPVFLGTVFPTC